MTKHQTAVAAWVEVEDGTPVLCLDTDRGTTETFELSPSAAGGITEAIIEGPQVMHSG
jgi:hypothetical protein